MENLSNKEWLLLSGVLYKYLLDLNGIENEDLNLNKIQDEELKTHSDNSFNVLQKVSNNIFSSIE